MHSSSLSFVWGALLASGLLLTGACNKNEPGCASNKDCLSGSICLSKRCAKLCETDADCLEDNFCNGETCERGTRLSPVITRISGNSGVPCPGTTDGSGEPVDCIGNGFIVEGANLAGSAFTLISETDDSSYYFDVGDFNRSEKVELCLALPGDQTDLDAGSYTLHVTNDAGDASVQVQLLQGLPGEQGPAGEKGDKGDKGDAGDPGTGSGGAKITLYMQVNDGATTLDTGADRAYYSVDHDTGSIKIPDEVITALCGDPEGCLISLGMTPFGYITAPATTVIQSGVWTQECRFKMDAVTREWAVNRECLKWQLDDIQAGNHSALQAYIGSFFKEIDGTAPSAVVLRMYNACMLSEALPDESTCACDADASCTDECACDRDCQDYAVQFLADDDGFYLINGNSDTWLPSWAAEELEAAQEGNDLYPLSPKAMRKCELLIRD